jgi:hypothetical protein
MNEGIDAERAVFADQPRRNPFDEFEAWPPHQGAVAEHPEVACREFRFVQRSGGHALAPLPESEVKSMSFVAEADAYIRQNRKPKDAACLT